MADAPQGRLVHLTPRRMRIRFPNKRNDPSFFVDAQRRLAGRTSVNNVEINPSTGSILLHCADARSLLHELEKDAPFAIVEQLPTQQVPSLDEVRRQLASWETEFERWTGVRHDVRAYIFFALVLSAAYQLARGNIFAPAATLIWYATEALRIWGEKGKAANDRAAEPSG